ncbi:hypothetical protein BDR03DRAFT_946390, partial [Suillus americanus]
ISSMPRYLMAFLVPISNETREGIYPSRYLFLMDDTMWLRYASYPSSRPTILPWLQVATRDTAGQVLWRMTITMTRSLYQRPLV